MARDAAIGAGLSLGYSAYNTIKNRKVLAGVLEWAGQTKGGKTAAVIGMALGTALNAGICAAAGAGIGKLIDVFSGGKKENKTSKETTPAETNETQGETASKQNAEEV